MKPLLKSGLGIGREWCYNVDGWMEGKRRRMVCDLPFELDQKLIDITLHWMGEGKDWLKVGHT